MKSETSKFSDARRAQWRASYHKNKEKNRESIMASAKRSRLKHADKVKSRMKEWSERNPYSGWTEEQKEKSRAKTRAHYKRNHEEQKERWRQKSRRRYRENRQKVLDSNRKWALENPETKLEIAQRRRARRLNATVSPEKISAWMAKVKSKEFARCYYCDERFRTTGIHFDHIVPLAKGGQHSLGNICVSCAPCNLRKGTNLVTNWTRIGQQFLPV